MSAMTETSAIPPFYYFVFGCFEPFISIVSSIGALLYPETAFLQQAPWPENTIPDSIPKAALVTIMQLAHVIGLLGLISGSVMYIARKHLWTQPALQEKVVGGVLKPLLMGDFLHLVLTLWAMGDSRWDVSQWSGLVWLTIVSGWTLLLPRLAWYLGVGRYVDSRDGIVVKKS